MATQPQFISTPRIGVASLSSANTAVDGTGTITTLIIGAAAGTRVLEIDTQCATQTTGQASANVAALINIFLSLDGGTTWNLLDQISVTAASASNTVRLNRNLATYANLILPDANARLGCTTTIAQQTRVFALGGDF